MRILFLGILLSLYLSLYLSLLLNQLGIIVVVSSPKTLTHCAFFVSLCFLLYSDLLCNHTQFYANVGRLVLSTQKLVCLLLTLFFFFSCYCLFSISCAVVAHIVFLSFSCWWWKFSSIFLSSLFFDFSSSSLLFLVTRTGFLLLYIYRYLIHRIIHKKKHSESSIY